MLTEVMNSVYIGYEQLIQQQQAHNVTGIGDGYPPKTLITLSSPTSSVARSIL
jgi:hypothetical protein